jgi:hypothetical protein
LLLQDFFTPPFILLQASLAWNTCSDSYLHYLDIVVNIHLHWKSY